MKVLMFGWEFPPHITGGLGTACFGLTKALAGRDIDIIFVVPKTFGDEEKEFLQLVDAGDIQYSYKESEYKTLVKNFRYLEVGSSLVPYINTEDYVKFISGTSIEKSEVSHFSGKFNFSGKYGKNLISEVYRYAFIGSCIADRNDFDVIHAHDWLTYPAGIAAKEASGKPLVIHVHATEFDRSGETVNRTVFDIEKRGMEAADRIITVSNLTKETVINKYGIDPSKVVTVYNAVDNLSRPKSTIKKGVKEKIVTFLGRVTFQKGPEYFIEAAKRVLERDNNVRFVMAGSGDMLNRMIKMAASYGISTKFHFTGFLKGSQVDEMFGMSDVYVMPSVSEPFGISPLEAMRSNVPVIISKQSGVSEILKHAIKIDFWDIESMADAIYGLLHYGALYKSFRNLGKKEVESLQWSRSAGHVKDVYLSVLK